MVVQMRYWKTYFIASFLVLVLIGQSYTVMGQTISIADHVIINEVETNPPGDDSKLISQWVELYNPTSNPVNIGGWSIGATTGLRHYYTIPSGTIIQSQQFLLYTYGPLWFPYTGAVVQLKDSNATIVDETPPLTDQTDDTNSWQRMYDGYDTGSQTDWVFKVGSPGSSNGKPSGATTSGQVDISVATDKTSYNFGDTVNISGQVSNLVNSVNGYPQQVNLVVSEPNGFHKTFTLYPTNNLQFSATIKLDEVLGFQEGTYSISATYGDVHTSTVFSLGAVQFVPPEQNAPVTISVATDKPTYTISQPITLQGNVSKIIPLKAVTYKVYDPNKSLISQGSIFPDSQGKFSSFNPYQQHLSNSGITINSVNPTYGIYTLVAKYGDTTTTTSFSVFPEAIQNSAISLSTDKQVYAPGDTVVISGSTTVHGLQNVGLSPSMQIVQTFTPVISQCGLKCGGISVNTMDIKTFVNLDADNTFTYKLSLAATSGSLGNYRVTVSIPTGKAETNFVVVENPSNYNATTSNLPFSIKTDKTLYSLGDPIIISGQILNPTSIATQNAGLNVKIDVFNSTGGYLISGGSFINNIFVPKSAPLYYYAFPNSNGQFQTSQTLQRGIYHPGSYTLKATYGELAARTQFSVYDSLGTASQGTIITSTDKKVYGVGEAVNLNGTISGLTGTSSYTLTLTKPDGGIISTPLQINNGFFSWSWTIPSTATAGSSQIIGTDRKSVVTINPSANLYGIYRITISSEYARAELFFQVSQNPQQTTEISPIAVQSDKTEYMSTDVVKVSGQVIPQINAAAKEANTMVQIIIFSDTGQQAYRADASVNAGGQFHISVPLQPGVWKTGTYKIYSQYLAANTRTDFKVTNPFTTSSGKLQVFMTTDHDKYLPGQTVLITGRTSYIISIDNVDIAIGKANDVIVSEGQIMSKKGNVLPHVNVPFDQTGSFTYDYTIPNTASLGNYTVVAQVPFGVYNTLFEVVNQLPAENVPPQENATLTNPTSNATQNPPPLTIVPDSIGPSQKRISTSMIVEKTGKISTPLIPITLSEKSIGNKTYSPRELDGLLRVNPGDENSVNIKVSLEDGTCIIGQDSSCKVTKSTVQGSVLYKFIKIGNQDFFIGYSGTGERIEQFSILPANVNDVIPDGQWDVEIIKKDQTSRFYYQVSYIAQ